MYIFRLEKAKKQYTKKDSASYYLVVRPWDWRVKKIIGMRLINYLEIKLYTKFILYQFSPYNKTLFS